MKTARWRLFSSRVDRQEVYSTREFVGDAEYSAMAIDCLYVCMYVCNVMSCNVVQCNVM